MTQISSRQQKQIRTGTLFIALIISCIPIFTSNLLESHDILFHLFRIQGISDGLLQGNFPVRMQTSQLNGAGYPVSIMYGDAFLYPFAILHLLGFSLFTVYKLLILSINTFTLFITFFLVKRVTQSELISLTATVLWTLAPYRLEDVYMRNSVGEALALTFLPLIAYGLYSIVFPHTTGAAKRGWIWCSLGAAAVIYSHVISVLLIGIGIIPVLIAAIIKNHSKRALSQMALTLASSVLLSLAFVIPFFAFQRHSTLAISVQDAMSSRQYAAAASAEPMQLLMLFSPFQGAANLNDTNGEMPLALGWALLLFGALWMIIRPEIKESGQSGQLPLKTLRKITILLTAVFLSYSILATTLFGVWSSNLGFFFNKILSVLSKIQFPWRFLGPASFTLIVIGIIGLCLIYRDTKLKCVAQKAAIFIMILSCLEAGNAASTFIFNTKSIASKNVTELNSTGIMSGEYLPAGTDTNSLLNAIPTLPMASANANLSNYKKHGTSITFSVETKEKDEDITLPLLSYPYYRVENTGGDKRIRLVTTDNNLLSVHIPKNYAGRVSVSFTTPWYWSLAFYISLITMIALCLLVLSGKTRRINSRLS